MRHFASGCTRGATNGATSSGKQVDPKQCPVCGELGHAPWQCSRVWHKFLACQVCGSWQHGSYQRPQRPTGDGPPPTRDAVTNTSEKLELPSIVMRSKQDRQPLNTPVIMTKRRQGAAEAYYIELRLGELEIMALIDTGAMVTTLAAEVLERSPKLTSVVSPCDLDTVTGLGGNTVEVLGEVHVSLHIGNLLCKQHRMIVIEGEGGMYPCVLGMDFLDTYCLQVDTVKRVLRYVPEEGKSYQIPVHMALERDHSDSSAVSVRKIIIPARTGQLIEVPVEAIDRVDGCMEPLEKLPHGCLVARSLNTIRKYCTKVEIINVSESPLIINKGEKLTQFEPLCRVYGAVKTTGEMHTITLMWNRCAKVSFLICRRLICRMLRKS